MIPGSIHRWARLVAGASLTLLAIGLLAPATARASGCGRHVRPDLVAWAQLQRLILAEAPPAPALPTPAKAPCSGPECSEGRPSPFVPPAAGPGRVQQEWATLPKALNAPGRADSPIERDEPGVQPLSVASPLDRPPRSFA